MNCLPRHKNLLYSKRELNCDNINYKLQSCCHVLFWFAIDRALWININTNAPFFNTHRLEAEVFLKLLNLSRKKIKMLFTGLGRSVLGETVPSVWVPPTASGGTQDLGHSFSQYGPPSRWITYIYVMFNWQLSKRHLLTSVTWLYRGLKCTTLWGDLFLKLSAGQLLVLLDRRLRSTMKRLSKNNLFISTVRSLLGNLSHQGQSVRFPCHDFTLG